MAKIKELYEKYKEIILYLIFGGLTTVVSFVSFWLCDLAFGVSLVSLTEFISWLAAVVFAYVVNKLFVFESKSWAFGVIKKEIPPFILARVFSYLVEWGGILLLVYPLDFEYINLDILGFNLSGSVLAKLILSIIVVIMNYFFSKFIIFRKKNEQIDNNILDGEPCQENSKNSDNAKTAENAKNAEDTDAAKNTESAKTEEQKG